MNIMLLEDDYLLNNNITEFLTLKNVEVETYTSSLELLDKSKFDCDLAILDIEVPEVNGYEIIEWIKRINSDFPIIFISAYLDIESIEKAYSLGCADYLKKPFNLMELWLRIEHIIDDNKQGKVQLTQKVCFDTEEEQLYCGGYQYKLTKIQRKLLHSLIRHKNCVVTYETLISEVWCDKYVKANTIATHIKEIRRVIQENIIESIRAEGYCLHL